MWLLQKHKPNILMEERHDLEGFDLSPQYGDDDAQTLHFVGVYKGLLYND